jgi:hypothetical protein
MVSAHLLNFGFAVAKDVKGWRAKSSFNLGLGVTLERKTLRKRGFHTASAV